jgi:CheY-like chemotaxis protein
VIKLGGAEGAKLDMTGARVVTVGQRQAEQDILAQMLMGFGVSGIQRSPSASETVDLLDRTAFDLAFVDAGLKDKSGYELIEIIRRDRRPHVQKLPIILVQGHVRKPDVWKARDCGANFVLAKPFSPQICFDRIVWLVTDQRPFIECAVYVGPDRRFKSFGPPAGQAGRRHDDLSAEVGEAVEANLSQEAVDGFFGAKRAVI